MEKILNLLSQVYSHDIAKLCLDEIKTKIDEYKNNRNADGHYRISEKDSVLISYGDNIFSKNQSSKLKTLTDFLNKHVGDNINTVHLLPFFPFSSDDGFSVIDYYKINNEIGDWEDITEMSRNYRLMFDAVINHVSAKSKYFNEYLKENKDYSNFFIELNNDFDTSNVIRPRVLPLTHKFETKGAEKEIWTTFSKDQVDLNYENYNVLLEIINVLLFYVKSGAKIIRLDAIAFLWKQSGTTCMHLEKTHLIIKLLKLVLRKVSDNILIITETNVPHKYNISYLGKNNDEADMVYNFTLAPLLAYSIVAGNTKKLTQWAQSLKLNHKDNFLFNFTASHDGVGVYPVQGILDSSELGILKKNAVDNGAYLSEKNNPDGSKSIYEINCSYLNLVSYKNDQEDLKIKKMILSQAIMLSMPGVPGIYIHSLLGSQNYQQGVKESGIKRRINREKLEIEQLKSELKENYIRKNIFSQYMKLLAIRKHENIFSPYGSFNFIDINEKIFCIERFSEDKKQKAFLIFNLSDQSLKLKNISSEKSGFNLISGENINLSSLIIEPYDFLWLKLG